VRVLGAGGGGAGFLLLTGFFEGGLAAVVGVDAGLLLLTLAWVICWQYFLSLLARVFSFALGDSLRAG
jgi:hypothetical protein